MKKVARFRLNPIVRKDLKVISRSMKYSWGLFAYVAVLAIVFLFTLLIVGSFYSYGGVSKNIDIYEGYITFFPVIGVAQLGIISIIVPIITASSISGEREKQTLDVMLTTTTTSTSIVIGKITSAVIRVMSFVIASIPLMAASFVMGGLSWAILFEYIILAFIFAVLTGSIGTFCSAVCKKTIPAIILSYVIYAVIYGVSYIPAFLMAIIGAGSNYYWAFLADLINPIHTFLVFFVGKLSGESLVGELISYGGASDFVRWLYSTNVWLVLSSIVQLGASALFVYLASLRIRPGRK